MQNWYEGWQDITYIISENSVPWPDQPPVRFERISDIQQGDVAQVTVLHLSAHSITHADATSHFLADGTDITHWPLSAGMGPCRVISIRPEKEISPADLEAYENRTRPIEPGDRLLFRTQNSDRNWTEEPFDYDYMAIGNAAADWLANRGVRLVGVDYLSVGPYETTAATHHSLLGAKVWVVESLDLREISEGDYEMICLPLRLKNCDASPARVLLRKA